MASRRIADPDLGPQELQEHIRSTYINIRVGIALIGILFPLMLWIVGHLYAHLPLQDSMSAYYHAIGYEGRSMRNWFVGLLFVVGVFLYLYKGYGRAENVSLNIAGLLAVGVAIFPMHWNPPSNCDSPPIPPSHSADWITLHGSCAIGLFLCIAYVALFRSDDTLELIKDTNIANPQKVIDRLRWTYRLIGMAMVGSMIAAYALNILLKSGRAIFWVEAAGVLSFGAYWLAKSWELKRTAAELKTIRGETMKAGGKLMSVAPSFPRETRPTQ